MSMRRHEFPILEFDDDMHAVIEPDHEHSGIRLPPKAAFVFLDDRTIDRCAAARGALWGELLYTADSLADAARYDARGWGADSMERALTLCLDAAHRL